MGLLFRAWATKVESGLTFRRAGRSTSTNVTKYAVTQARTL